jgi:hypothetical protein
MRFIAHSVDKQFVCGVESRCPSVNESNIREGKYPKYNLYFGKFN